MKNQKSKCSLKVGVSVHSYFSKDWLQQLDILLTMYQHYCHTNLATNHHRSMFDANGFMRVEISTLTDVQYVLDGGSLLHHIPVVRGLTFGRIAQMYACQYEIQQSNRCI